MDNTAEKPAFPGGIPPELVLAPLVTPPPGPDAATTQLALPAPAAAPARRRRLTPQERYGRFYHVMVAATFHIVFLLVLAAWLLSQSLSGRGYADGLTVMELPESLAEDQEAPAPLFSGDVLAELLPAAPQSLPHPPAPRVNPNEPPVQSKRETAEIQPINRELLEVDYFHLDGLESAISNLVEPAAPAGGGEETLPPRPDWAEPLRLRTPEGRRFAVRQYGGSERTEQAVERALTWLARAQEADGSWSSQRHQGRSGREYDVAVTALATLAFLGAGNTEAGPRHADTVRRAIYWLRGQQLPGGRINQLNYSHGLAALALVEHYGLTRGGRDEAQRAIDWLAGRQCVHGGWDYFEPSNRGDTSITGWQVMALKSADGSGLERCLEPLTDAARHFTVAAQLRRNRSGSRPTVAYVVLNGQRVSSGESAMLAVGLASMQFLGWNRDDPWVRAAGDRLLATGPLRRDFYQCYYGTMAMFNLGGRHWQTWNRLLMDALLPDQETAGADDGSWDPRRLTWGQHGGRVYSTALGALCLEVYYRYLPVYTAE